MATKPHTLSSPPPPSDATVDDPVEFFDTDEHTHPDFDSVALLGHKTPREAYRAVRETVSPEGLNRFMRKQAKQQVAAPRSASDYRQHLYMVLRSQLGREMIQNAAVAKGVTDPRILVEYGWLNSYLECREQTSELPLTPFDDLVTDSRHLHPLFATLLLEETVLTKKNDGLLRPAFIPSLVTENLTSINALFCDLGYFQQMPSAMKERFSEAMLGVASLTRSYHLFGYFLEYIGGNRMEMSLPDRLTMPAITKSRAKLTSLTAQIDIAHLRQDSSRLESLLGNLEEHYESICNEGVNAAIAEAGVDVGVLKEAMTRELAAKAEPLGISVDVGAWERFFNRLSQRLDSTTIQLDPQGLQRFSETLEREIGAPLLESVSMVQRFADRAHALQRGEGGEDWNTHLKKMTDLDSQIRAWLETNSETISQPPSIDIETLLPAIDEPAPRAELVEPESDEEPTPWSDEDIEQVLSETQQAKAEKAQLESQVKSLSVALEHRSDTASALNFEGVQAAMRAHIHSPNAHTALALLAHTHPDRVRVLDSAWEALADSGEAVTSTSVLQKLTPLITDGLDALRAGARHIEINDIVPGELKFSESDTVQKNAKLMRLREFRDGSITRAMSWHMVLDYAHRVYFEHDTSESRIVIGYVGKHLPGARHSTV